MFGMSSKKLIKRKYMLEFLKVRSKSSNSTYEKRYMSNETATTNLRTKYILDLKVVGLDAVISVVVFIYLPVLIFYM
jgi:hypothetical protein